MSGVIATIPRTQFFSAVGAPLAGFKLYTYLAGTTTPTATFQDQGLTAKNENPIKLDAAGGCSIWLDPTKTYKFVLKSPQGLIQPGWPVDNISGASTLDTLQPSLAQFAKLSEIGKAAGSSLMGYQQGGPGSVKRSVQERLRDVVNVKDFGAKGDGVTDDTAAITAAYNYFTTNFFAGALFFPKGNYIVTQLVWQDLYFKTICFEGATLCGVSKGATYDSVLKIINAENLTLVGSWTICAESNAFGANSDVNKYTCGLSLQAAPGGQIEPTKGILTFVDIYGLSVSKVRTGVVVNSFDSDAQVAEITFHGLKTPFCPNPVRIGGSQTVVNFVGGTIASTVWPTITNPEYITFLIEGGAVSMAGGEITNHGDAAGRVIDMRPASSSIYRNPYGAFTAVGTLVETRWPMLRVNNPRALISPLSTISHTTLSGCYGYSGELPAELGFMSVDDASYAGKITVDDGCHFYQNAGAAIRAAATINCSTAPKTIVNVGRRSFSEGYPYWMSGVAGGRLVHGMELAVQGYLSSGTAPSGVSNLKPTSLNTSPRFARYNPIYDMTSGVITMPASGSVDVMRIEATILVGAATGDFYLRDVTNGQNVAFGQIANGVANLVATVAGMAGGQQFALMFNLSQAANFGGSITNNVSIYLSSI